MSTIPLNDRNYDWYIWMLLILDTAASFTALYFLYHEQYQLAGFLWLLSELWAIQRKQHLLIINK